MKQNKRVLIIKALEELIQHKRFSEVKVDDIASIAKVGKGTVYRYFSSKEHLYFELSKFGLEELLKKVEKLHEKEKEIIPFLKNFIKIFIQFGKNRHEVVRALREIEDRCSDKFSEYNKSVMAIKDKIDSYLTTMITKGQEEGLFDKLLTPEQGTQFVIHTVFSHYHYKEGVSVSAPKIAVLILRGLGYNE